MKKLNFIILFLFFDFLISNLILKNTNYWNILDWEKKYWRISSEIYHHGLMPNIDKIEKWGGQITKRLITNSIGFIDKTKSVIVKNNAKKKRILLIGDSFIEGSGLDYKYTVAGLLDDYLGKNYEILNSAVGSYSPSIYFKKTEHFINQGYKFDQALVFLDVSDIYDELFVKFDENGNILTSEKTKKQSYIKKQFYNLGRFLRDNTVTFRFLNLLSDKTETVKNYLKLKYKSSKNLNKGFFETDRDDVMFFRMTHIDRGYWTFNNEEFSKVKNGIEQSEKYLIKLFQLFKNNKIPSTLIIYPWPTQILYGDKFHQVYWKEFAEKNNVNIISMYNSFISDDNRQFIFDNFLYGDIHWNKKGTKKIFNNLIKNINF